VGDRYGVGPELVARLVATLEVERATIVGDPEVFASAQRAVGLVRDLPIVRSFADAPAGWSLLARPTPLPVAPMGRLSADAGREVLDALALLVEAAKSGQVGGIVYAPLNKQAMKAAGHAAGDELEFFNSRLPTTSLTGEINILGELWTSRATSHVPLARVAALITRERVGAGIDLLARALRNSGIAAPRLAVAALNPHAGEGGAFGMEEIEVLTPAIADARARGVDAAGPFPSDTIFPRAVGGAFDGVVTMFHDQGQIALKMVGLGQGITLLAGFPVPIATPGHGTAYDIAGTGRARPDGMLAATRLILRMMSNE
jgi:4-hydroxythreonine-4-phosphate dehydrogenase